MKITRLWLIGKLYYEHAAKNVTFSFVAYFRMSTPSRNRLSLPNGLI